MDIIVVMLFVSLAMAFSFLGAFLWANKKRQFDDLVSPAWRAILEDETIKKGEGEQHGKSL